MVPPPPYIPAPHLIASSCLTAQQLVSHFEDFSTTLRYATSAPELVFERLVANLSDSFNAISESGWQDSNSDASRLAMELREQSIILQNSLRANEALATELVDMSLASQVNKEATQQGRDAIKCLAAELEEKSVALQSSQVEKEALQLANTKLTAELAELKEKSLAPGPPTIVALRAVVKSNPIIGDFHTNQVRSGNDFRHENCKTIPFASAYTMVPGIVVGLAEVSAACNANVRAKAYTSNIQRDSFKIHIDSWMNTTLYAASCRWLQIEADDMDFQYGSYHTLEDHDWYKYPTQNTRKIKFKRPYSATPKVVLWLTVIDTGHGSSWRIRSYTTDVTATGFTIHIDSLMDCRLYSAMASWVAYPANRPGIASGVVSTHDIRSWAQPQACNSAFEAFEDGVFEKPPRIFIALNALSIDRDKQMRLRVNADNVSASGMAWHLDAWADTILYSAGASYIAFS